MSENINSGREWAKQQIEGLKRPEGYEIGSDLWVAAAASADPFAGDFGDGERTLADKVVIARKDAVCHGLEGPCERGVRKGERARSIRFADSEGITSIRICQDCLDIDVMMNVGIDPEDDADEGDVAS